MSPSLAVFVAEDEPLIAMMLEDFLDTLGHRTAAAVDDVAAGVVKAATADCDVAILDVQLNGEAVWPVADVLIERGVKILIATGGHVEPPPRRHADHAVLPKPYTLDGVEAALSQLSRG